ncbi:hypothetical protein G6F37_012725 [Rhizopus arrhizus]|nr:hypothetical protein G6F38_012539 [Rhizopus arrhizus]KAG1141969.1 hypothetical protein G6F37_012725 [Rhizopus arrhizus]
MAYINGHFALANANMNANYRPALIDFHGYEGEDLRHFVESLESYFAINNITQEPHKLIILKAQLRRAAKVYYEKEILKRIPGINYEQAVDLLKNYYITPELIQSYELEFNEMYQGEQELTQIFLARLKEAADLANITNDAVIESRFRAGLLREIKQFCIQSSSKNLQDWINHAEGWWNANRPRKIAMVDNPFIPRNVNQALIYHNESHNQHHHLSSNHNIDLIDTNEHTMPALAYNQIHYNNAQPSSNYYYNNTHGTNQLTAMDTSRNRNQLHHTQYNEHQHIRPNQQQDLIGLIQQAIRQECGIGVLFLSINKITK